MIFKHPKLVITCPHGKEQRAIEEVMNILLPKDINAQCVQSKYPGVLLVYTKLEPKQAALILRGNPTSVIFKIVPCEVCVETSLNNIVDAAIELARKYDVTGKRFYVDCTRRGRRVESSLTVEKYVGYALTRNLNCKVDMENPDFIVKVEIVDEIACIAIMKPYELTRKKLKPR